VAFDEKVFSHDTKISGLVKVVPNKKVAGLWFFTGACRLDSGYPFMLYCRAWTERPILDQHVATLQIIQEQCGILKEMQTSRHFETISVWDAYYPTLAALQWMREQNIPFIFSINKDRFGGVVSVIERFVKKTGDMAWAERAKDAAGDRDELCTLFHSPDARIGVRCVLTNALIRTAEKKAKGTVPGFDHYEASFNIVDVFNRSLCDKRWPHRYSGRHITSEMQAGADFLFTTTLVNLWHLWRTLQYEERKGESFESFCTTLAKGIVQTAFQP
jgi:hypothetical protein